MQRRDFLQVIGGSALAALTPPAVNAGSRVGSRLLVLVEMKGGNDGLNTVVPYLDPAYYMLRPRLAIGRDRVIALGSRSGLHPALAPLLALRQAAGRPLMLTHSEFGRRVAENPAAGTDCGTAAVHFAFGARVRGGFYGKAPELGTLDRNGNLLPRLDFRAVYATVLEPWLNVSATRILGQRFETEAFLRA